MRSMPTTIEVIKTKHYSRSTFYARRARRLSMYTFRWSTLTMLSEQLQLYKTAYAPVSSSIRVRPKCTAMIPECKSIGQTASWMMIDMTLLCIYAIVQKRRSCMGSICTRVMMCEKFARCKHIVRCALYVSGEFTVHQVSRVADELERVSSEHETPFNNKSISNKIRKQ